MCNILLLDLGTPRDEISEPIGIETLAAYVEAALPEATLALFSMELSGIGEVEALFSNSRYDVIGISTKIRSLDTFNKVLEAIYTFNSDALIVIGDILSTFAHDKIVAEHPDVICVRGEGEQSLPLLIKRFVQNPRMDLFRNTIEDIPNLAYNLNGRTILTRRSVIDVTEARHPKRVLLKDVLRQNGISHVEASRGCIYRACSFCGVNEKYANSSWRPFNLGFVLSELELLSSTGFRSPYLTDEDFFGNDIERVYEFCRLVANAKQSGRIHPAMNFYFNARVASIIGDDFQGDIGKSISILRQLQQVGLREVFIGVESGCREQCSRYKKGTSAEKSIRAIRVLMDLGIDVDIGFIFFDPKASLADLRENMNFILRAGLDSNYSRIIKKLRLQPFTAITSAYMATGQTLSFDLNLVSYDYEFESDAVSDIYNRFCEWERDDLDIIYNMQSFCRGEVKDEDERKEVKGIISAYRSIDACYMNALISAYEDGATKQTDLDEITRRLRDARAEIDREFIDKIQWYDSSYRRTRRIVHA